MTKDVFVSVRGDHFIYDEVNKLEIITTGSYYLKNGKHYIIYDEIIEGDEESTHNTIKVSENCVEMIKSGIVQTHMIFKENYTDLSSYVTEFCKTEIGVTTSCIDINEEPDHLVIRIDYTMEIDSMEYSSSCVEIDVKSKATANLNLREK